MERHAMGDHGRPAPQRELSTSPGTRFERRDNLL